MSFIGNFGNFIYERTILLSKHVGHGGSGCVNHQCFPSERGRLHRKARDVLPLGQVYE